MRVVIVYGGRFHPFHKGHKEVYEHYVSKYGADNVYVATSPKQDNIDKPFSFAEKKAMMVASGVPANKITQEVQPYVPKNLMGTLDTENTVMIFPVGADDAGRFAKTTKKDGTPAYMQHLKGNEKDLKPASEHSYVDILPRYTFKVLGKQIQRGTDLRALYTKADDAKRLEILTDMYGAKAKKIKPFFDKGMSILTTESYLREFIEYLDTL